MPTYSSAPSTLATEQAEAALTSSVEPGLRDALTVFVNGALQIPGPKPNNYRHTFFLCFDLSGKHSLNTRTCQIIIP
jgi:hypothetical protein